ncbi:MAG: hypothetical protein VX906_01170 [Candidatus Thermoplasmatota archaeon]|nr:hypothetical protein [Candidatus Thermoplasmatota archaeon]
MRIRYAVAGSPVEHSLSPALFALTVAHLEKAGLEMKVEELDLIDTKDVMSPMAWAWVQKGIPSDKKEHPLYGDFSSESISKLIGFARSAILQVEAADIDHVPHLETLFNQEGEHLRRRRGEIETWISITSPLKHLLNTRSGIHALDGCLENGAVNQLRWDGINWYAVGTDGFGLVSIAQHFGFDFDLDGIDSPLLCMVGGGGSARSCAASWAESGGKIWPIKGRRDLGTRGSWKNAIIADEEVVGHLGMRLFVDFDTEAGKPSKSMHTIADIQISASYSSEKVARVVEHEGARIQLDGRWLLAAQHLQAWSRIYSPEFAHLLPGLGLTMTRLIALEKLINSS